MTTILLCLIILFLSVMLMMMSGVLSVMNKHMEYNLSNLQKCLDHCSIDNKRMVVTIISLVEWLKSWKEYCEVHFLRHLNNVWLNCFIIY